MTMNPNPQLNDTDLELLSAYIDQLLPAGDRTRLEARLGQEPALREALAELRSTVAALRALEPVRPPRSFTINPATAQRPVRWWSSLALPFGGLAMMLLVAVLLVGFLRSGSSVSSPTVASAPTSEQAQLQAQTYGEPEQATAVAQATASKVAPAAVAPPALAQPAPAAPALAATSAPVAESAAPAAADSQVAGARSANEVATATPAELAPALTTPAISSPGTTTLDQAPAVPAAVQPGPPILPIALVLALLIGMVVVWIRRRKE